MNPLLVPEVCLKKQTNKKPGRRENLLISGKVPNRIHAEARTTPEIVRNPVGSNHWGRDLRSLKMCIVVSQVLSYWLGL